MAAAISKAPPATYTAVLGTEDGVEVFIPLTALTTSTPDKITMLMRVTIDPNLRGAFSLETIKHHDYQFQRATYTPSPADSNQWTVAEVSKKNLTIYALLKKFAAQDPRTGKWEWHTVIVQNGYAGNIPI